MMNEYPSAESMLALAERLRRKRKQSNFSVEVRADLRLAGIHLRQFALVLLASQPWYEPDTVSRSALVEMALKLRDQR